MKGGGASGGFSRAFSPLNDLVAVNPGLRWGLPGGVFSRPFRPAGRAGRIANPHYNLGAPVGLRGEVERRAR